MENELKFGSVCSGIEAASVAWNPLGWKAAFFSEIEKFPCAVLKHHYPDVPNLGDMTKFKEWPDYAIDLLVGGTPCQSFSVAGLRKGLDDPRGNLMLTYLAIAGRYRPRWVVWENVPGVLSIDNGRAFGTFLGGLAELGYGFAYRVLDAQYAGVPQRRRRVFVIGHLGDWRRAAAVLFERHSLQGHTPPSREKGKGIAPTISARTKGGGGLGTDFDCDGGLQIMAAAGRSKYTATATALRANQAKQSDTDIVCMETGQASAGIGIGIGTTLNCNHEAPIVAFLCKDHGGDAGETAPTLRSMNFDKSHANAGGQVAVAFQPKASRTQSMNPSEICPTLRTTQEPAVAFKYGQGSKARSLGLQEEQSPTLGAADSGTPAVHQGAMVRRLTPRECERLMGMPDDYTFIPWRKGKFPAYEDQAGKLREPTTHTCPDSPRYRALGNSMAVPVMRWIGERIQMVEDLE